MKTFALWTLFFVAIFCIGYTVTALVITTVMADLVLPTETGITTLRVEPVPAGTLQTDQYTPIQPATSPIGKEL